MTTVDIVAKHLPTLDEALARFAPGEGCELLDCRDAARLAKFVTTEQLDLIGLVLPQGVIAHERDKEVLDWNAENVTKQIAEDVEFAFQKSLNKRGISASLMNEVLEMWHGLLRLPFEIPEYPQYDLPMCKAMAVYLELPNEIGEKAGDEFEFSTKADGY